MLSIVSRIITGLLALLLLTACGSNKPNNDTSASGKTTIEFWHYQAGPHAKAIEYLLRKFEAANPDIAVKAIYQGNPNQLKQKLDSSFASGTGNNPAVSLVYENWTDDFVKRGYIDPVQNYIDGPDGLSSDEQKDFVSAFIEGNTWNDKLMTLPFNKSIYMLYLNMDMLNQAGMTTAPKTQFEFADAVKKLTRRANGRTSVYGMGVIPKGEAFTTLLLARGGELVDGAGKPHLNSPKALEVVNLLKNLQFPDKNLYINMDYMSMPFGNGLIASFIYSSSSLPYNKTGSKDKFEYRAAPIPGVDGAAARYLMQGTNIAMFANKPESQRKAAWRLIKFLVSPENGAYFITRSGYMPYRYSMLQQPEVKKYIAENPDYAVGCDLVLSDKGKQEPKVREWEGIRIDIDTMVDQLLSRSDSNPAVLLDALQKKAEAALK